MIRAILHCSYLPSYRTSAKVFALSMFVDLRFYSRVSMSCKFPGCLFFSQLMAGITRYPSEWTYDQAETLRFFWNESVVSPWSNSNGAR